MNEAGLLRWGLFTLRVVTNRGLHRLTHQAVAGQNGIKNVDAESEQEAEEERQRQNHGGAGTAEPGNGSKPDGVEGQSHGNPQWAGHGGKADAAGDAQIE